MPNSNHSLQEGNTSSDFSRLINEYRQQELSGTLKHQITRCLIDYMGCCLAGKSILATQLNKGNLFYRGFRNKLGPSIENDIYRLGLFSHAAELDDGCRYGAIHPGAPIISALLPLAMQLRVNGADLYLGIATGYQVAISLAASLQPQHYKMGYHPTATCGSVGAAAGIIAMLGRSSNDMERAIGAAMIAASGSLKVIEDGSEIKPYNAAQAAVNGWLAAFSGISGFQVPRDCIGGDTGFAKMMCGEVKTIIVPKTNWINQIYFKPYAACRHAHPSIEAVLSLRSSMLFALEDIKEVRIETYSGLAGKHDSFIADNVNAAKMSIPISVAIALVTGKSDIRSYTDSILSEILMKRIARQVNIVATPEHTAGLPDKRGADIIIISNNGDAVSKNISYPLGDPENPIDDRSLEEKYFSLANFSGLNIISATEIKEAIYSILSSSENFYKNLEKVMELK